MQRHYEDDKLYTARRSILFILFVFKTSYSTTKTDIVEIFTIKQFHTQYFTYVYVS